MSRYYITTTIFLIILLGSLALDGLIAISFVWYACIIGLYLAITTLGVSILSAAFFVNVKYKGKGNQVSLTFDDGPVPGQTERILRILKEYNAPATFFCIGHRVDQFPDIVKEIHENGHIIGNHTYWHGKLFDLKSALMVTKELYDTDVAIFKTIGKRPRLFRPPYGVTNPMIAKALRRLNHSVIGWSIRSFDTVIKDPERLFQRVTRSLHGGDVILFHDYSNSMIEILPRVLDHINKMGLKIVTVDKLLNEKAYG